MHARRGARAAIVAAVAAGALTGCSDVPAAVDLGAAAESTGMPSGPTTSGRTTPGPTTPGPTTPGSRQPSQEPSSTPSASPKPVSRRAYQVPGPYLKIVDEVLPATGAGAVLRAEFNGARVRAVADRLGVEEYHQTMSATLREAVRDFQRGHGLAGTGDVDKATWLALDLPERQWTSLDTYVAPLRVDRRSSREDHVEAMIDTALAYRGARYVWGGSNAPRVGVDCSGLVLQSLYGAGLDPRPITTVRHTEPGFHLSSKLYHHDGFKHVPLDERRRGDLLFYGDPETYHVAIYLGDNRMMEAVGWSTAQVAEVRGKDLLPTVVRPFP
jgi:cell wall-associated NlpC family hydrolase